MALGERVTVGDSATLIYGAPSTAGVGIRLFNAGANDVDIGGSSVTFGAGMILRATGNSSEALFARLNPGEELYGIAGTGNTEEVHVLVTGE